MASVLDVATYILRKQGTMDALKLQKLVYYSQGWSLVWDAAPLFPDRIEAWAHGPVAPRLYSAHRGRFMVRHEGIRGDSRKLVKDERETVNVVLGYYGKRSSHWLSSLTHREKPWKDARQGLAPGERGHSEITHNAMAEYYASLV